MEAGGGREREKELLDNVSALLALQMISLTNISCECAKNAGHVSREDYFGKLSFSEYTHSLVLHLW